MKKKYNKSTRSIFSSQKGNTASVGSIARWTVHQFVLPTNPPQQNLNQKRQIERHNHQKKIINARYKSHIESKNRTAFDFKKSRKEERSIDRFVVRSNKRKSATVNFQYMTLRQVEKDTFLKSRSMKNELGRQDLFMLKGFLSKQIALNPDSCPSLSLTVWNSSHPTPSKMKLLKKNKEFKLLLQ